MRTSADTKVQQLLDDLMLSDGDKYALLQLLRQVVMKCCPAVAERVMYGGIMFSLAKDFGGLFVYKKHISFEFTQGYRLQDPNAWLEGKGKFRRHLKLVSNGDIERKQVAYFVEQAIENITNT
ncbi:MAG: hypothetical protein CR975_00750 [Gammaproteobacteria bacterium]|nr:MAG: hypothetical protein CR975_00750 [Gammaproteobacteria bacterium]